TWHFLSNQLDARIRSYALNCRARAAGRIDSREDQKRPTRPAGQGATRAPRPPERPAIPPAPRGLSYPPPPPGGGNATVPSPSRARVRKGNDTMPRACSLHVQGGQSQLPPCRRIHNSANCRGWAQRGGGAREGDQIPNALGEGF